MHHRDGTTTTELIIKTPTCKFELIILILHIVAWICFQSGYMYILIHFPEEKCGPLTQFAYIYCLFNFIGLFFLTYTLIYWGCAVDWKRVFANAGIMR